MIFEIVSAIRVFSLRYTLVARQGCSATLDAGIVAGPVAVWWTVSYFFGRSCDPLAKIQERIQMYERTAPPAIATSFEALPHSVGSAITGCNALPASQTRPLLYRTSKNKMMTKRTSSLHVVLRLCPNVQ